MRFQNFKNVNLQAREIINRKKNKKTNKKLKLTKNLKLISYK